jgi:hypothetical protein
VQEAVGRQQVWHHGQVHARLVWGDGIDNDAQVPRQAPLPALVEVGSAEVGAVEGASGVG